MLAGKQLELVELSGKKKGKVHYNKVPVSPINPTSGFQMDCTINGVWTPFLLDTGAAVTLLRKDTWDHVNLDNQQSLQLYSMVQLVGVDGSLLTVHRSLTVNLHLDGHRRTTNVVVVSPLTSEAILVFDFLQEHQAHIDLPNHWVYLAQRGISLPLQARLQSML